MSFNIKRNEVLKELDVKEDLQSRPSVFSIKFIKKDGELVYLKRAVSCGLKANLKENRLRAARPVDEKYNAAGHVYPFNIDSIIEFNGMKVIL